VLTVARWFHPLVCESVGWRESGCDLDISRQAGSKLIESLRNLSQLIGKTALCFSRAILWQSDLGERASGLRVAGRGRQPLILPVYWRHVGVNRHKVTMLQRVLGSKPTRLGQETNRSCVFQTHRAGNLHRRSKKTFTRRPRDTLRSHLSCIRCEWCSPN
jgi:hypothetical protein